MIDSPRLTPLDIAVGAIGILTLASLLGEAGTGLTGSRDPVPPIDTRAVLTVHEAPGQTAPEAARAFAAWADRGTYTGAFAIGDAGSYGWVDAYNSLAQAEAAALAYCAQQGENCRLAATLTPVTPGPDGLQLRADNRQGYHDHLDRPGYAAWAVSPNGATGWSASHSTGFEARARAIDECELASSRLPDFLPAAPCVVVSVRRPWE